MKMFLQPTLIVIALVLLLLNVGCVTKGVWGTKAYSAASLPGLAMPPEGKDILVRYDESCFTFPFSRAKEIQPRAYWLLTSTNRPKNTAPEFVKVTADTNWISVPLVPLDLRHFLTNKADRKWLVRDERWIPRSTGRQGKPMETPPKPPHSIFTGTNTLGQQLYVTNSVPERSFYWKISSSPERYVAVTNAPPEHGFYAASWMRKYVIWQEGNEVARFELPFFSTHGKTNVWRVVFTPFAVIADTALIGTAVGGILAIGAVASGAGIPTGASPGPGLSALGHL
jgi:hypothetical protein